jgi:phage terminase small subunit
MTSLTLKRRKFVHSWVELGNGEQAAIAAGFSPKSARSKGSQLLNEPRVKEYLELCLRDMFRRFEVTAERIIKELACTAFFNPRDLFTEDGNIKKLSEIPEHALRAVSRIDTKTTDTKFGQTVEITKIHLWNKLDALEKLAKMHGFSQPDVVQQNNMEVNINYIDGK